MEPEKEALRSEGDVSGERRREAAKGRTRPESAELRRSAVMAHAPAFIVRSLMSI